MTSEYKLAFFISKLELHQQHGFYNVPPPPAGNGVGDVCESDTDGDGVPDSKDVCPEDPRISVTDFTQFLEVGLETGVKSKDKPVWQTYNNVS